MRPSTSAATLPPPEQHPSLRSHHERLTRERPFFPKLTWEPVAGAAYYRLWVGTLGSGFVSPVTGSFPYAAGTDISDDFMVSGDYEWYAAAYTAQNVLIGSGPGVAGHFTIVELADTSGQKIALDGSGSSRGGNPMCEIREVCPREVCGGMKSTPVLDWKPVSGAAYYLIYLSRDQNFQNLVYGSYSDSGSLPYTSNSRWTPTETLPDSQAGVAYYWFIRPCKSTGICAPDPLRAWHAFDKRSSKVETETVVAPIANDVTFEWTDYLKTNQNAASSDPSTGEQSSQAARGYHVQVATSPAFTSIIDETTVDQTTYTAYTKMYPEGDLWWRVQAVDGTANLLSWSDPVPFTKTSPSPAAKTPTGPTQSTQPFRWSPTDAAVSYDLEVYKNGDTAASLANRVVSANSKQVAYTLTSPLPAGTTYVWRVRREDASRNKGGWSAWATFSISALAPVLYAPAAAARVASNDALFTWSTSAVSSSYRFERRLMGASSNTETVTTYSTAWAPYRSISTGTWQWRVSSLDASNNLIQSSDWRTFSVDATAPTVLSHSPGSPAARSANFIATFSEAVNNVSTTTMLLRVDGTTAKLSATVTLSSDRRMRRLIPPSTSRLASTTRCRSRQASRIWPATH